MEEKNLICIGCPMGCPIHVYMDGNGEIGKIEGHTCSKGETYAKKEVLHPTRMVTSTVRVRGSSKGAVMASCKTSADIPKGKIYDVIADIQGIVVQAPLHIGDVIKANVANTGVDMVATKEIY